MNDSLIEEIKSIPGVTDVMPREIVSVNLNGTRYPADIVSKNDFDFMRQDGDIGSMDYDPVSYTHLFWSNAQYVDRLQVFVPRIFQFTAFVADVPDVLVAAVDFLSRCV